MLVSVALWYLQRLDRQRDACLMHNVLPSHSVASLPPHDTTRKTRARYSPRTCRPSSWACFRRFAIGGKPKETLPHPAHGIRGRSLLLCLFTFVCVIWQNGYGKFVHWILNAAGLIYWFHKDCLMVRDEHARNTNICNSGGRMNFRSKKQEQWS